MVSFRSLLSAVCIIGVAVVAEQNDYDDYNNNYAYDDANNNNGNDDANNNNNDDAVAAAQAYYYDNLENTGDFSAGDDTITYWTDYAILPKRCIL